jgi:micrococcal nuclease
MLRCRLCPVLLAAVVAGGLAAGATGTSSGGFQLHGTVTYVVDGDTVHVQVAGGREERVRLIGIDTPEVGQCDAAAATALARRAAEGRAATLVGDPTQATRDRYGRLLAYVWVAGRGDLGYQQLLHGLARVYIYDRPFQRLTVYRRAARIGSSRPDSIQHACGAKGPAGER